MVGGATAGSVGSHQAGDWPGTVSVTGCATSRVLTLVGGGVAAIISGSISESSVLLCILLVGHAMDMEVGTTSSMENGVALAVSKTPTLQAQKG